MTKKPKPILIFEIVDPDMLSFCHDEVVALAAKMASFKKPTESKLN